MTKKEKFNKFIENAAQKVRSCKHRIHVKKSQRKPKKRNYGKLSTV